MGNAAGRRKSVLLLALAVGLILYYSYTVALWPPAAAATVSRLDQTTEMSEITKQPTYADTGNWTSMWWLANNSLPARPGRI